MSGFPSLHSSSRRPNALKAIDYDHEIFLIDRTKTTSTQSSHSRSQSDTRADHVSLSRERRYSDDQNADQLRKRGSLREELARKRYSKFQDRREGENLDVPQLVVDGTEERTNTDGAPNGVNHMNADGQERGRPITSGSARSRASRKKRESAIDILYENQRGGFLCGFPLFSSKALGALDAAPWTNIAQKPSLTDPTNAQPPDPSWEWAWKEWKVNHTDQVDEDGWAYSFAFSKKGIFSWHGPTWWNSYVRRRAWLRKRVKSVKTGGHESHQLTADYFTIHSAQRAHSRSSSNAGSNNRYSLDTLAQREMRQQQEKEDIESIGALMKALKQSRIDREKSEAVENFIDHGGDDLYYLAERMHDIMSQFIFQAARHTLFTYLSRKTDEALAEASTEDTSTSAEEDEEANRAGKQAQRVDYLQRAMRAADEEVKKLEFWSDIRHVAEHGDTAGAVKEGEGWGDDWKGLDNSGPRDVLSEAKLPQAGESKADKGKENGKEVASTDSDSDSLEDHKDSERWKGESSIWKGKKKDKGKGKE